MTTMSPNDDRGGDHGADPYGRDLAVVAAQPVGQLEPQPWMTRPATRAVLAALTAEGDEVRFIGGCVRDAVVKRKIRDIDLALARVPTDVMGLLQRAGIRVIPTGIDHGTVTAIVAGDPYEITSLRIDVETDGRRARVAYTDDWMVDAARRDFTINALSCTPDGAVYDYFNGLNDLGHGRIRFVGDARARIGEDVLRLLRFFRFYAHYGKPPPDADALAACRAMADRLPLLSGERVRVELLRTLMSEYPAEVFELMRDNHVLAHVLPEASDVGRLRQLTWLEGPGLPSGTVVADAIRRLAALVVTDADGSGRIAERLRLSNRQRRRLAVLVSPPFAIGPDMDQEQCKRLLYRWGAETVRDIAILAWASERVERGIVPPARGRMWLELLTAIEAWRPVAFPLKGSDALALGVERGPRIGRLLREVEVWWTEGGFRADRAECLGQLRQRLAAAPG
ncbi:MAG: CCA tRNA nucleotidyltransferase [Rhodospirillales bacterium]